MMHWYHSEFVSESPLPPTGEVLKKKTKKQLVLTLHGLILQDYFQDIILILLFFLILDSF